MRYPHILLGMVLAGLLLASIMGCSNGSDDISSAQAIDIAKTAVIADGVMTLTDRDEVAVDEGTVWHVSFPLPDSLTGEPHVRVAKTDGSVVEIYYTQ